MRLFQRTAHGMRLTSSGAALLPLAERVLSAGAELIAKAGELVGSLAGRVRVGLAGHPRELRLPELLRRATSEHPAIVLELHRGWSTEVQEDVRRHRLDAGFVLGTVNAPDLERIRLGSHSVYVAAPAMWKDEIASCGWKRIHEKPWVVGAAGCFCGQAARKRAGDGGRVVEVDHPGAVLELVTAGVCAGLLHENEAITAESAGTVLLWREQPITADLFLVWARGASAGTATDAVVRLIIEV